MSRELIERLRDAAARTLRRVAPLRPDAKLADTVEWQSADALEAAASRARELEARVAELTKERDKLEKQLDRVDKSIDRWQRQAYEAGQRDEAMAGEEP